MAEIGFSAICQRGAERYGTFWDSQITLRGFDVQRGAGKMPTLPCCGRALR
jgi:hypothetical protein